MNFDSSKVTPSDSFRFPELGVIQRKRGADVLIYPVSFLH